MRRKLRPVSSAMERLRIRSRRFAISRAGKTHKQGTLTPGKTNNCAGAPTCSRHPAGMVSRFLGSNECWNWPTKTPCSIPAIASPTLCCLAAIWLHHAPLCATFPHRRSTRKYVFFFNCCLAHFWGRQRVVCAAFLWCRESVTPHLAPPPAKGPLMAKRSVQCWAPLQSPRSNARRADIMASSVKSCPMPFIGSSTASTPAFLSAVTVCCAALIHGTRSSGMV